MTLVNLFFFAHQPERLRPYERRPNEPRTPERIHHDLFDEELNATIFHKVANKCYYPATRLLLELVEAFKDDAKPFRLSFGLSGTFLDQAQRFEPELLDIFKRLGDTGMVEFTAETYYHSLCSLWDDERAEFKRQVQMHVEAIQRHFGQHPTVFRNTECLYNNGIAQTVKELGFAGIMTEGIDWVLDQWRSPDFLYQSTTGLPVLLRNYRYSDDIGYRFPNKSWEHYPLTAEKFAGWLAGNTDEIVNLMMDYEALGEHIWADTGIFDFIRHLPEQILKFPQLSFTTPGEAVRVLQPRGVINVGQFATISWADMERDTSAWLRNEMQQFCFEELREMERDILATHQPEYIRAWRLMQTSDHVYYLSDKSLSDGDVHTYFSAYGSLFESFVRLQTAITDLKHAALYAPTSGAVLPESAAAAPGAESANKPRKSSRARTKVEAETVNEEAPDVTNAAPDGTPPKPRRTRKPKEQQAGEET